VIYSVPCGDYTIYVIEDGFVLRDPLEWIPMSTEADWDDQVLEVDGRLRNRFGCFLLEGADRRIMIDAGMGSHHTGDLVVGKTPDALATLGVDRDSIEMVIQTHMHFDHIGGTLSPDGAAVYPNARHVYHAAEWAHWSVSEGPRGEAARSIVEPLLDAGLVDFIDEPTIIGGDIEAVETPGHTPGHVSVRVKSGTTEVLIGGDLSNHPLQVKHPDWSLPVDTDPELAAATRGRLFNDLLDTGILFLAGHYPTPGVGVIANVGDTAAFVPTDDAKLVG
jgi:glyoxylase-like metal-dependent hydrolase (beta-lactamase superfamily II)